MKCRSLGALPVMVSEIGLGTAQLANVDGQFPGVKLIPLEVARNVLTVAVERGVTFFDTGDEYGAAESLLGELPRSIKQTVFIATKAGRKLDGMRDFSSEYLRERVHRSLRRLGVDYLDLFQVNKPSKAALEDGSVFEFLDQMKREGKIRYAGLVVGEEDTGLMAIRSGVVDCLQVLYNLLYAKTEDLIAYACKQGLGVIIRSPLNSGLLAGTYTPATTFPVHDDRSRYFTGRAFEERLAALYRIQKALNVENDVLLEFSLTFVLSNPSVSVVIPGASSVGQVERYVACSGKPSIGELKRVQVMETVAREMLGINQVFQT